MYITSNLPTIIGNKILQFGFFSLFHDALETINDPETYGFYRVKFGEYKYEGEYELLPDFRDDYNKFELLVDKYKSDILFFLREHKKIPSNWTNEEYIDVFKKAYLLTLDKDLDIYYNINVIDYPESYEYYKKYNININRIEFIYGTVLDFIYQDDFLKEMYDESLNKIVDINTFKKELTELLGWYGINEENGDNVKELISIIYNAAKNYEKDGIADLKEFNEECENMTNQHIKIQYYKNYFSQFNPEELNEYILYDYDHEDYLKGRSDQFMDEFYS